MIDCPLCTAPKREDLLYTDDLVYLVPTKDMKGHIVRVMVCTHRHTTEPEISEVIRGIAVITNYMSYVMCGEIWHLVEDIYASHPHHWHRIACCDLGNEDELVLLAKTPKQTFNISVKRRRGPPIEYNDPFHVEQRKRMRESRARKKAQKINKHKL